MDNNYNNPGYNTTGRNTLSRDYRPNEEEAKVLAECRLESNIKGSVSSLLLGAFAHQSIKYFNLKVHPKFGVYPKVGSACIFGFILGKFMAIPSCYQKLKNLPDSPIGAYIRQKTAGMPEGLPLGAEATPDINLSFPISSPKQYNDGHMNSAIDIDVYNSPSSMDSYTGNELNGPGSALIGDDLTDQNQLEKPTVSYAELRKRNREEYVRGVDRQRTNSVVNEAPMGPPIRRSSPAGPHEEKNKYGDVWG